MDDLNKKDYDLMPHTWILECLELYFHGTLQWDFKTIAQSQLGICTDTALIHLYPLLVKLIQCHTRYWFTANSEKNKVIVQPASNIPYVEVSLGNTLNPKYHLVVNLFYECV